MTRYQLNKRIIKNDNESSVTLGILVKCNDYFIHNAMGTGGRPAFPFVLLFFWTIGKQEKGSPTITSHASLGQDMDIL